MHFESLKVLITAQYICITETSSDTKFHQIKSTSLAHFGAKTE